MLMYGAIQAKQSGMRGWYERMSILVDNGSNYVNEI